MRYILVCGGRDYADRNRMTEVLSERLNEGDTVVHGGAPGADALAGDIAGRVLGHTVVVHPADWATHGKAAGPIRNQKMLDSHPIDELIAFPGGRGTQDMVRRAQDAGVKITLV